MKDDFTALDDLEAAFPQIRPLREAITAAYRLLAACYDREGTVFACGNGGSCADADHITGELLKGFCRKRPMTPEEAARLAGCCADAGQAALLSSRLQRGLRAISLMDFPAAASAVTNDLGPDLAQAQLLYALGKPGDVLIGISTSGNAANVAHAVAVAKMKGIAVIGLTGEHGGRLAREADVAIRAPVRQTYRVQECHLPIYHALCRLVEARYFDA